MGLFSTKNLQMIWASSCKCVQQQALNLSCNQFEHPVTKQIDFKVIHPCLTSEIFSFPQDDSKVNVLVIYIVVAWREHAYMKVQEQQISKIGHPADVIKHLPLLVVKSHNTELYIHVPSLDNQYLHDGCSSSYRKKSNLR